MKITTEQKSEYEFIEIDENGDVQEIEFFDTLTEARNYKKEHVTTYSAVEIWRYIWTCEKDTMGNVVDYFKDDGVLIQ